MGNYKIYKDLITAGCFLWCLSFFGEVANKQPYSTIGIIISPMITIIGIYYWFQYYHKTRGYYPPILKKINENLVSVGGENTLRTNFLLSHILEFWTVCILFWMSITLLGELTFKHSDAFNATKQYCETNQEVLSKTGKIKYYGSYLTGSITNSWDSNGEADFYFTIVGEKGNFHASSVLTKSNGVWNVDKLEIIKEKSKIFGSN